MRASIVVPVLCMIGVHMAFADTPGPSIVPRPMEMEVLAGGFGLSGSSSVSVEAGNAEVRAVGEYLAECLNRGAGVHVTVAESDATTAPKGSILLTTAASDASLGDEGYELLVSPDALVLRAPTPCGLSRGVQTIRQLLPPEFEAGDGPPSGDAWTMPCVRVKDKPRYAWRGSLLDCCRHFMTKDFVKRYIDLLAYHKMNVLHWHLTEDQGWRIEIKKYPKLTEVGAWRGPERYGGVYTQDDVREVVAYAKSRYVTIVPEIEMPGHSQAALAAYPELSCTGGPFEVGTRWGIYEDVYCAGNDKTFEFLQDVLTEVLALFPSQFIHIGGDECPKTRWHACPKCQQRIKAEGLKDEHELQSYFIKRIETFLDSKGRRLVGWDEILEGGLAPNATVQSWRGMGGAVAAATTGHDVIASPYSHCYLDASNETTTLERAYSFEPTPEDLTPEQATHILGVEGNMWTEGTPQDRIEHQVYPRLCALAEVGWSPKQLRDWGDFARRMQVHYRRLDALGVTYYVTPPRCLMQDTIFADSVEVAFDNPAGCGVVRYTLDGTDPTPDSPAYTEPLRLTDTTTVKARLFLDSGNASDVVAFTFTSRRPLEPVVAPSAQPGLRYEYYEGEWDRLPDFDALRAAATGIAKSFDISQRKRDDRFAFRFTGYIDVPADGIYTFRLTSDDGSKLWIGDLLVVDNDGLHSMVERRGQVLLKAGRHPITVAMFEATEVEGLSVAYEGPGVSRQPIPAAVLSR
jgi:hexosaminidase